jgi:hypothetical protein
MAAVNVKIATPFNTATLEARETRLNSQVRKGGLPPPDSHET